VLTIDTGTLASISVARPERFAFAADTEYTLADDGTRRARSILSGSGLGAMLGRAMAQNLEKVDRPATARKLIESAGLSGSGDYSFPNPRELSDSYAITTTFQISSPVDRQQAERVRMLPLTEVRPSLAALTAGGASGQPFPCRSLEYRETSSLTVPEGTSFYEKPAPLTYLANVNGETAFGRTHGRIEVNGAVVLDGRTLRSSALVRLTFDAAVCPAEFAAAIKTGLDKFTGFKYGPIGLTPSAAPDIADISPEFSEGVSAFQARNYKLALARLKPFAEMGNAKAQSYVGSMYEAGRGVQLDRVEAIAWFQKAGEQGDAYSQSHLGYAYEGGLGVARDEKLAAEWYAKAAEQGDAYGEARLASLYRDGRGLTQDFEQAAKWFGKAADQESTWAQMNLGLLYIKGQGVPQDYTKAMYWLHKAADRNDSYAQYNLGWAYESGTGVAKDREEAIKWYGKASNAGNQEASARLAGLTAAGSFWGILFRHLGLSGGL
jgi:TPR repeat protein